MRHGLPLKDLSPGELALLIRATAAYQHSVRYKALHKKLLQCHLRGIERMAPNGPITAALPPQPRRDPSTVLFPVRNT